MAFKLGDFTTGNAFYWQDEDLTIYAGNDSGLTPYSIVLTDAAGKTVRGFIGAVGAGGAGPAGESLDSELLLDTGFDDTSKWSKGTSWSVAGSVGIKVAYTSDQQIAQSISSINCLYWLSWTLISRTAGSFTARVYADESGYLSGLGIHTSYLTSRLTGGPVAIRGWDISAGTVDDFSCKRVLDPPSTGVHIVSAYGGSVRAWASIDSGFNPNTITSAVVTKNIWNQLSNYYRRRRSS